jgi:hypothetical protein
MITEMNTHAQQHRLRQTTLVPEAVRSVADAAMRDCAGSVNSHLKEVHLTNAIVRAALRRARSYAARAGVSERELVEYLKGKLL